jgi:hypothetical protein
MQQWFTNHVSVTGISETAVQVALVARALSCTTQGGLETQLRERAYLAFLESGVSAPVPRRIVRMQAGQAPPVRAHRWN